MSNSLIQGGYWREIRPIHSLGVFCGDQRRSLYTHLSLAAYTQAGSLATQTPALIHSVAFWLCIQKAAAICCCHWSSPWCLISAQPYFPKHRRKQLPRTVDFQGSLTQLIASIELQPSSSHSSMYMALASRAP